MSGITSLRVLLLALSCAACSKPAPPPTEQKPEPQAPATAHTQLRDAIQQPLDKAKAVEDSVLKAADAQKSAIDAATQ